EDIIAAPMVSVSELPWRMMLREKFNVNICFSPMINSKVFSKLKKFGDFFQTCKEDRPLIVQFCGNDPNEMLESAKKVEQYCDGVDLNLGCPQNIAKSGRYGAFLQNEWEIIERI
ncbi:MAG: tRNA-dihydrouridine(16/17) synthase [NAD(P)(+)]-like protein, partial [Paramarteilia canceri]